ncbi:unnamed protein product [Adineta steineri]|nr:unnamed protein product [Adineta steineri]
MGRCLQNTALTNGHKHVSSDELGRYIKEIFDQETNYVRKAQKVKQMMVRARDNSSQVDIMKIIKIVDDQISVRMKHRSEL